MTTRILTAVFTLLLIGQLQNSIAQTTITMQREGGVYTVPCTVNGLKLRFIFDTGASDVSISATEALFMLKNGYLNSNDILGEQKYSNASGDISVGTVITLRKIEFAGLTLNNIRASVVHSSDAPLLLGQTAIQQLGGYKIDGDKLTISNAPNNSYDNTSSTSYSSNSGCSSLGVGLITNPFERIFSGTMCVCGFSPIYAEPDMLNSKQIGSASNNQVEIISRTNERYYYVKSGNVTGYLFAGWFHN